MKPRVLYFSRFSPSLDKGGGSRRLMQILELLADYQPQVVTSARADWLPQKALRQLESARGNKLRKYLVTRGDWRSWSPQRRQALYRLRTMSRCWANNIKNPDHIGWVLMDDPFYFVPLVKKLRKLNIPIAAVCHNLESLVPVNVHPRHRHAQLKKEIDILGRCTPAITISREETTLLGHFHRDVLFFPYHPPRQIVERLLQVRKKRGQAKKKEHFLLLGSAVNRETRQGMRRVIAHWERDGADRLGGRLLAAGYKTDTFLQDVKNSENVTLLGPLANDDLDNRLSSVKACICYQEQGGGALTRICEMLCAGAPVLANAHAARSYHDTTGVVEFGSLDEIAAAVKMLDSLEGRVPIPPPPDADRLLHALHSKEKPYQNSPTIMGKGRAASFRSACKHIDCDKARIDNHDC